METSWRWMVRCEERQAHSVQTLMMMFMLVFDSVYIKLLYIC